MDRIPNTRRIRVEYAKLIDAKAVNSKLRLFALLDILAVFSPITSGELRTVWNDLIGNTDRFEDDLAMAMALKLAKKEGEYLVRIPTGEPFMYSFFGRSLDSIRSGVLLHYFRKDRQRARAMELAMLQLV